MCWYRTNAEGHFLGDHSHLVNWRLIIYIVLTDLTAELKQNLRTWELERLDRLVHACNSYRVKKKSLHTMRIGFLLLMVMISVGFLRLSPSWIPGCSLTAFRPYRSRFRLTQVDSFRILFCSPSFVLELNCGFARPTANKWRDFAKRNMTSLNAPMWD